MEQQPQTVVAAVNITNAQELEACLMQLTVPNTEMVRIAEESIKAFAKQPQCVPAFLEQIRQSKFPVARQLAAVLMRKRLAFFWPKLDVALKQGMKQTVLEILVQEQEGFVRKAVTTVASTIARYEVPKNNWNELLQFVMQCTQSQNPAHREVSMVLFTSLTETIGMQMKQQLQQLVGLFGKGLADPSPNVQQAALKAVGALVVHIETQEEVAVFQTLLNPMIAVIQKCLDSGNEDTAVLGFEIFDDIIELELDVFDSNIPDLIKFMLQVATNTNFELITRERAINFINWVVHYKPNIITKSNLLEPIIHAIFQLLVEPEETDSDTDSAFQFSYALLDDLALEIPNANVIVFRPVVETANMLIQHKETLHRKAGFAALAVIAQGCQDSMRENLNMLLPLIEQGMKDPEGIVRECACVALREFSENLQPDIITHYKTVLPLIFAGMNDPSERVKEKSCFSLESFGESLGADILPYLPTLMERLTQLLQTEPRNVQEIVVSTISSAATAAGKEFIPYADFILKMMATLMQQTQEDFIILRARATECVGIIALAVEREFFDPYIDQFFQLTVDGFALDDEELREYTYGFYSNLSNLMEEDFAPRIPAIIEQVFASIVSEDGVEKKYADEDDSDDEGAISLDIDDDDDDNDNNDGNNESPMSNAVNGSVSQSSNPDECEILYTDDNDEIDEDEDDEDLRPIKGMRVRTAFLDEKASAIHTLGAIAEACGLHFVPYIERARSVLMDTCAYFHEEVRMNTMTALKNVLIVSYRQLEQAEEQFSATPNSNVVVALREQHEKRIDVIVDVFFTAIETDDDKDTVGKACECIAALCKEVGGQHILAKSMDRFKRDFKLILLKKVPAFKHFTGNARDEEGADDDKDEDAEQVAHQEQILLDTVSESLDDVAQSLGADFEPIFSHLYLSLLKYAKPNASPPQKIMSLGCLANISDFLGPAIRPYIPKIMPLMLAGLSDPTPNVQRNSVFGCGILIYHGGEITKSYIPQMLQGAHLLFNREKLDGAVVDNAASALSRAIIVFGNALPLAQIVPVFLSILPLQDDLGENEPVYQCLLVLLQTNYQVVSPYLDKIMTLFCTEIVTGDLDGSEGAKNANHVPREQIDQMTAFLRQFQAHDAATFSQLLSIAKANINSEEATATLATLFGN